MEKIGLSNELHKKYGRAIPGIDQLSDEGFFLLTFDDLFLFLDLSYRANMQNPENNIYVPMSEAMDDLWTEKRFKDEPDMIDFKKMLDEIVAEVKIQFEKESKK